MTCGLMTRSGQAQPIPDTLDWRRYFLLEVGNQWQYRSEDFGFVHYTRWYIRGDTLIEAQTYFIIEISGYDANLQPLEQLRRTNVIRYDTTNALIVERTRDQAGTPVEIWWLDVPCGLDAPFQARHECTGIRTGMDYFVDGLYNTSIVIGSATVDVAALKLFDSLGGGWTLAADIGLVGSVVEGGSPVTELVYAHVGGQSYGEAAIPTASEQAPEVPSGLAITVVYPNPFSTTTTLVYQAQAPGRLSVELYDVLGRRVRTYEAGSPGSYQIVIDGSDLSAGTYFVRLVAPSGGQSFRTVTLIK